VLHRSPSPGIAQLVREPMAAGGGGAIITVASVAGLGTTSHDCPEYAVAKAGGQTASSGGFVSRAGYRMEE
jgi:NAD(P)-dependent dehydrogenase (short-subunit alcohol dehydrogenase family)